MDPHNFLDGVFQLAALHNFAKYVEENQLDDLIEEPPPEEGEAVYALADEKGENPLWLNHEDYGLFVTHDFEKDLRMVCWAEIGPDKLREVAVEWWKENNPAMQPPPEQPKKGILSWLKRTVFKGN